MIAVNAVAVLVNRQAAIGIAVVSKTQVKVAIFDQLTQLANVGATAVHVDVLAVRLGGNGRHLRAQRLEHALAQGIRAAVCAVQRHLEAIKALLCQRNQEFRIRIALAAGVNHAANLGAQRVFNARAVAVQVSLACSHRGVFQLFAVSVEHLNAVVLIRVVTCGNHNAKSEVIRARDVGNARSGHHTQKVRIRATRNNARRQRMLKHVA